MSLAQTGADKRHLQRQWNELQANRQASIGTMHEFGDHAQLFVDLSGRPLDAANRTTKIAEMYREIDTDVVFERKATGDQALMSRLLSSAVGVNIGKKLVEKRRVGEAGKANVSMSGQTDIVLDHTQSKYQGCVVPIFDSAYGRDWREVEAERSEAFDGLSEDSREIDWKLRDKINDFLWNGDKAMTVKGQSWLGLKADPTIATSTLGVDLSAAATTATDIVNELIVLCDVLRVANRLSGPFELAVSPQIWSNWHRISSTADSTFGNIMATVKQFLGGMGIMDVFEDSSLQGNQVFLAKMGPEALHAKSGMAISSYALPRYKHNDAYNFVKWGAFGFMAVNTYSGYKCAVYAES